MSFIIKLRSFSLIALPCEQRCIFAVSEIAKDLLLKWRCAMFGSPLTIVSKWTELSHHFLNSSHVVTSDKLRTFSVCWTFTRGPVLDLAWGDERVVAVIETELLESKNWRFTHEDFLLTPSDKNKISERSLQLWLCFKIRALPIFWLQHPESLCCWPDTLLWIVSIDQLQVLLCLEFANRSWVKQQCLSRPSGAVRWCRRFGQERTCFALRWNLLIARELHGHKWRVKKKEPLLPRNDGVDPSAVSRIF